MGETFMKMSLLSLSFTVLLAVATSRVGASGECGTRYFEGRYSADPKSSGYIVGGSDAVRGSLPWQVSIRRSDVVDNSHWCGGTIIDKRWILTASHCLTRTIRGLGPVVAGEHTLNLSEGSEQKIEVVQQFKHPPWDHPSGIGPRNMENDIALLKLAQDIRYDKYTQPACLPKLATENEDYKPGNMVIISGWGSTKAVYAHDPLQPTTLQVAQVPLIADDVCKKEEYHGSDITDSMICAGKLGEGGVDSCQGDSGGPMVMNVGGKYTVLGVVSFGEGCARPDKPGIYTRVARFDKWIQNTMRNN